MANKKGAEFAFNKIMIVVIVLIVLATVIFFIFRADLLTYIRNLPGYSTDSGDKFVNISADPAIFSKVCSGDKVKFDGGKLMVGGKEFYWVDDKGVYTGNKLVAIPNGNYLKVSVNGVGIDSYDGYLIVRSAGAIYLCKE